MSIRLILAAAAALALASPALAQDAPAASAPSAAEASDPAEAALEAKAQVFQSHVETMVEDMQAAVSASGGDQAKANADLDAIVARYQPEADAFADEVKAFMDTQTAGGEASAEDLAGMAQAVTMIRTVPAMVRAQVQQAAAAPPAPTSAE
jgi:hypothetical protein